jgi:hypothetical protein
MAGGHPVMSEREWLEGLRPEDDALDRLVECEREHWAPNPDRRHIANEFDAALATVREALERLREERDEQATLAETRAVSRRLYRRAVRASAITSEAYQGRVKRAEERAATAERARDEAIAALQDGTSADEEALEDRALAAEAEAELLRGARRYLQEEVDVQATLAVTRDISRRQYVERARRLTEGLRDLVILVRIGFLLTVNGERPTPDIVTDPKMRELLFTILQAEDSEAAARALLSANPPQGDAADFCEHGYTTEDSSHPSAGLERCPTCSPSDGGGAK